MKLDLKKFLIKLFIFIVIISILIFLLLFIAFKIDNKKFKSSYQYAINLKYKKLVNIKSPKIIIVSGSSGAFGINTKKIKEETNMEVVNLSLHAGFGFQFPLNIAKSNIEKNDLIVIAYEYGLYYDGKPEAELLLTGIDNNFELYKYYPKQEIMNAIKYLPTYVLKKFDTTSTVSTDVYSINSFDKEGNMIYKRDKCILPEELTDYYSDVNINKVKLDKTYIKEINDFYDYAKNKGADVVISFPPILNERFYYNSKEDLIDFENNMSKILKPKLISHISDYIFERDYMYDTIYHCNDEGEIKRSEILSADINKYLSNLK